MTISAARSDTRLFAFAAIRVVPGQSIGPVAGVIFHSDRGSTYTADVFTTERAGLKARPSIGRVGSALDNAASARRMRSCASNQAGASRELRASIGGCKV